MRPNADRCDAEVPPILLGDRIDRHLERPVKRRRPIVGGRQSQRIVVRFGTVDRIGTGIRNPLDLPGTRPRQLKQSDTSQHVNLAPGIRILLAVRGQQRGEMNDVRDVLLVGCPLQQPAIQQASRDERDLRRVAPKNALPTLIVLLDVKRHRPEPARQQLAQHPRADEPAATRDQNRIAHLALCYPSLALI